MGRFLSFDVKRSLFSCKRLVDQQTTEDSPATRKAISLKVVYSYLWVLHMFKTMTRDLLAALNNFK
jgi:hypothetical protein